MLLNQENKFKMKSKTKQYTYIYVTNIVGYIYK